MNIYEYTNTYVHSLCHDAHKSLELHAQYLIHTYIYIGISAYMYICKYVYMYIFISMYIYVYMNTYIHSLCLDTNKRNRLHAQ